MQFQKKCEILAPSSRFFTYHFEICKFQKLWLDSHTAFSIVVFHSPWPCLYIPGAHPSEPRNTQCMDVPTVSNLIKIVHHRHGQSHYFGDFQFHKLTSGVDHDISQYQGSLVFVLLLLKGCMACDRSMYFSVNPFVQPPCLYTHLHCFSITAEIHYRSWASKITLIYCPPLEQV